MKKTVVAALKHCWKTRIKTPSSQILANGTKRYVRRLAFLKATGIVRRIDELGRVVVPKEIRRTLRIREGDPSLMTLANWQRFCFGMLDLAKRQGWK